MKPHGEENDLMMYRFQIRKQIVLKTEFKSNNKGYKPSRKGVWSRCWRIKRQDNEK